MLISTYIIQFKGTKVGGEDFYFYFLWCNSPKGEWADPGGTAIPGQPVGKSEQAPVSSPRFKNQFNIVDLQWSRIRY